MEELNMSKKSKLQMVIDQKITSNNELIRNSSGGLLVEMLEKENNDLEEIKKDLGLEFVWITN